MRAERSDAGRAAGRGYPSPRVGGTPPRGRAPERDRSAADRSARVGRPPERRSPDLRPPRAGGRHSGEFRRPVPAADERRTGSSVAGRTRTAPTSGSRLSGALAVLGVFLLTLAAAAADSYIGLGLGMITLVALTVGTVAAALLVRRRDLLSVVVAPPLVFVAVAVVNIGLAPSATLNAATLATLLVRGFPAMGVATAAAVVIALGRLVAKR
ncbi:DUF6542 domain-containing protein [Modestobacter versicolor]|uniref:DUF6542 domain-containing protein n=1 Tax=Modestobacter versicolor TaxID=429133 RepID=UPI0034DEDCA5